MDDTLCNFTKKHKECQTIDCKYPQSQYGFFTSLEPIENAIESYIELEKYYDVWILTRPSFKNPLCYTEKRIWVENYLGLERCSKLILSPDKSLLIGDYLIDDVVHPGFIGEHIHFATDKFPDWKHVLKYFLFLLK